MRTSSLLLLLLGALCLPSFGQIKPVLLLTGTVTDENGKALEMATVTIKPGNHALFTNDKGVFRIELYEDSYEVTVNYLNADGYQEKVQLNKDTDLQIELAVNTTELEAVTVKAQSLVDVNSASMGKSVVDIITMKKQPAFLGEIDVIRSISALPGVVTAGEGASGFYVRGGSADQNLVTIDGAPVFNSAHLFGFFSIFNPDILSKYTLHRSGISAKYGGRISSILDVEFRDGSMDKWSFYTGISPLTVKVGMDGPIGKKTSVLLAARGANPNYLLRLFKNKDVRNSTSYFYDANLKVKHQFSKKTNLLFSSYMSEDGFKFPFDTTYAYGNRVLSLRLNQNFGAGLFANLTASRSYYYTDTEGIAPEEQFAVKSSVNYDQVKLDILKEHAAGSQLEFGVGMGQYNINSGKLEVFSSESQYNPVTLDRDLGNEYFAYLNEEWKLSEKFSILGGLRYSFFQKLGPGTVSYYREDIPKSYTTVIETESFNKGQVISTYHGAEPRFSMKYSLNERSSVKVGLNRMRQYTQLISNTSALTPTDVWRLSNTYIKPQIADQISAGYFMVPKDASYEFSLEVYYKKLYNVVDYKDGAEILLNPVLEADLLFGDGFAYGSEFFVKKNSGNTTGWVSLSVARAFRKISSEFREETINDGKLYPSNYDRPINLNVFLNQQLGLSPWTFSANFTYGSGRPITASDSWFSVYSTKIYSNYRGRNQQRMPDTHRLDVSFLRRNPKLSSKRLETEWGISLYNVYFRKNAFSTLFKDFYGTPPQAYRLAIIGIAVPSLNFNMKF